MISINKTMAKSNRKAEMNRARVKKYRKKMKLKSAYENAVRAELKRREKMEKKEEDLSTFSEEIPNSKNTYTFNDEMCDFKEKIICWSVKHSISKRALNDLLSILIFYGFSFLPKDSRTLMKTPVHIDIQQLSKGQMWYDGIKKNLLLIFNKIRSSDVTLRQTIHLDFNFDGVELFNSSKKCFWPIISSIRGIYTNERHCTCTQCFF